MAVPLGHADDIVTKASRGDAGAQLALGIRFRDADGVKRDYAEAMRWGHLAADRGHADAMDFVGWMFFGGIGVPQNPALAFGYFKAAAVDSAQGAYNLGLCYFGAQGTEQDIPKALAAWKSAAARGHGRAASSAAMAYLSGEGIAPDAGEARQMAERAAQLNDPSGLVVLGELQFQAGELDAAKASWTRVSQLHPTAPTGNPEQPSGAMSAQQGADLLKLMTYRQRQPERGKFALVKSPHIHQGWNNCGATSCATLARFQGAAVGGWDFKRLCPSSPLGTGTDWAELVEASAKLGLKWKLTTFAADAGGFDQATAFLREELDAGRPVVIDFKYIGPQYPGGAAGHTLGVCGYSAAEHLYILCNPAIASPGLQFMSAQDLEKYWRSDGYSSLSNNVLSRPAITIER